MPRQAVRRIVLVSLVLASAPTPKGLAAQGSGLQTLVTLGAARHSQLSVPTGWGVLGGAHLVLGGEDPSFRVTVGSGVLWDGNPYEGQESFVDPELRAASEILLFLPEVGVTWHRPSGVPAFAGTGLGYTVVASGQEESTWYVHLGAGLQLSIGDAWVLRPEVKFMRMEVIGWDGVVSGLTIGIGRR